MYQFVSGREYPAKVIPLIDNAKHYIDVIMFEWRWYPKDPSASVQIFNQAVIRAIRRGVEVRAITNNDEINTILNTEGAKMKRIRSKKLMHTKFIMIDDRIIILGSHNITQAAFEKNIEYSTIIENTNLDEKSHEYFETLFNLT